MHLPSQLPGAAGGRAAPHLRHGLPGGNPGAKPAGSANSPFHSGKGGRINLGVCLCKEEEHGMENGKNILVTVPVEETHVRQLQEAGPGCTFRFKAGTALPSFQRAKLPFENLIETDPVTQEDINSFSRFWIRQMPYTAAWRHLTRHRSKRMCR